MAISKKKKIHVPPVFFVATRVELRYSNTRNGRLSLYLRLRLISQNHSTQCAIIYLQCCELTAVKNLPLGLYNRMYLTVCRELRAMGFSESLPVEFLKVDYYSGSFVRAIRSCFAENINFSRLKYQLIRTLCCSSGCEDFSSFFSSRHLCLWTRERFCPTVTALDNCEDPYAYNNKHGNFLIVPKVMHFPLQFFVKE